MIASICTELEMRSNFFTPHSKIETIYFGGGTPSVLTEGELETILAVVYANYDVSGNAEITLECNPDDLNRDYLKALYRCGVNRLSIGIQSFNDAILTWMNRSHTNSQSLECIEEAGKIGFRELTIDLIYGIPQLALKDWETTVDFALKLPINHLSAYSLTLENNTPYKRLVEQKKYKKPDNDLASNHFEILVENIEANGWEQYEVSNFCIPGNYSKHNTAYWQGKSYLGIGPSAHSFNGSQRFWNASDNKKYVASLQEGKLLNESEILTVTNKFNEQILTGLRTKWGINLEVLQNDFGIDVLSKESKNIEEWRNNGWVVMENKVMRLSKQGFLFADFISSELFLDDDYSSQTLS